MYHSSFEFLYFNELVNLIASKRKNFPRQYILKIIFTIFILVLKPNK